MAKNTTIQSADFKKDYVTVLAVGLFVFIVLSELFVAVSIPITINHTALYAEHGVRQKVISEFDSLRSECSKKPANANPVTVLEKKLIRWDLDIISTHMREYSLDMPIEEIEAVGDDIMQYKNIVAELNQPGAKPFCKAQTLDLSRITQRIEKKLDSAFGDKNIKK